MSHDLSQDRFQLAVMELLKWDRVHGSFYWLLYFDPVDQTRLQSAFVVYAPSEDAARLMPFMKGHGVLGQANVGKAQEPFTAFLKGEGAHFVGRPLSPSDVNRLEECLSEILLTLMADDVTESEIEVIPGRFVKPAELQTLRTQIYESVNRGMSDLARWNGEGGEYFFVNYGGAEPGEGQTVIVHAPTPEAAPVKAYLLNVAGKGEISIFSVLPIFAPLFDGEGKAFLNRILSEGEKADFMYLCQQFLQSLPTSGPVN
jgi:hypothetical protein